MKSKREAIGRARSSPAWFLRPHIGREAGGQVVENGSHQTARPQVSVHGDPDLQVACKIARQNRDNIAIPSRDGGLADADPKTRSDRGKLGEVAVGSQREIPAPQFQPESPQGAD